MSVSLIVLTKQQQGFAIVRITIWLKVFKKIIYFYLGLVAASGIEPPTSGL